MKTYLCILASAALLAACEQKTETVAPAAPPKTENHTTIVNPTPATSTQSETTTTTTTATATPGEQ